MQGSDLLRDAIGEQLTTGGRSADDDDGLRHALEQQLGLPDNALDSRKEEIKDVAKQLSRLLLPAVQPGPFDSEYVDNLMGLCESIGLDCEQMQLEQLTQEEAVKRMVDILSNQGFHESELTPENVDDAAANFTKQRQDMGSRLRDPKMFPGKYSEDRWMREVEDVDPEIIADLADVEDYVGEPDPEEDTEFVESAEDKEEAELEELEAELEMENQVVDEHELEPAGPVMDIDEDEEEELIPEDEEDKEAKQR